MASFKIYLLTTILFASEGYSQLTGPRRSGTAMIPTGPVICTGKFCLPAVVKPILPSAPYCQPGPVVPVPQCADLDDPDTCDDLILSLISALVDCKKGTGRKSGRSRGDYDWDGESARACPPPYAGGGLADGPCSQGAPDLTVIIRPAPE